MYIIEKEEKISLPLSIISKYDLKSLAYFDIETTGFDRRRDSIILISFGFFKSNENFLVKQYFAENLNNESDILEAFFSEIGEFHTWCSYNGIAFDEPFINSRLKKNKKVFQMPKNHFDLYIKIRPYYRIIGLERCNLKTVEKHLGLSRKDDIDGGESVELYKEYLESKDENIREKILLHNYEDVLNLPQIFTLLNEIEEKNIKSSLITKKQFGYIKSLLSKNKITLNYDFSNISKSSASNIIDKLLHEKVDEDNIIEIINEIR